VPIAMHTGIGRKAKAASGCLTGFGVQGAREAAARPAVRWFLASSVPLLPPMRANRVGNHPPRRAVLEDAWVWLSHASRFSSPNRLPVILHSQ